MKIQPFHTFPLSIKYRHSFEYVSAVECAPKKSNSFVAFQLAIAFAKFIVEVFKSTDYPLAKFTGQQTECKRPEDEDRLPTSKRKIVHSIC